MSPSRISFAATRMSSFHMAGLLLVALGLAAGCSGRARDVTREGINASQPDTRAEHFTPEAVNALRTGMSEKEIVAALGHWDERVPDMGQELSSLEYDALANNPVNGFLVLELTLKKRQLVQARLRSGNNYLCECIDSFRQPLDTQCREDWAKSCLTLLSPPAKTCAAADWPATSNMEGRRRIEVVFDPVEHEPTNAESWARAVESRVEGFGTVHLVWYPRGWRLQSACIKTSLGDLANRLPPRDMRQEISQILQLTDSEAAEAATPAVPAGDENPSVGGGTVRSISAAFSAAHLQLLRQRLNAQPFQDRLRAYTCGDQPPAITFTVSLVEAAEYQEREVSIQPRPNPSPVGRQRCLMFGLGYELDREVGALDHGEPIDYHYKDPHTGQELPADRYQRSTSLQPVCDCSKRDANVEWVTWPAQAAAGHP